MSVGREIAKLCREAALNSVKRYNSISAFGNIWTRGIESYISAKIAEGIYTKFRYPIELEFSKKELLELIGARNRVSDSNTSEKSRFDVVVFRKKGLLPYGIIEVKKRFQPKKQLTDYGRVTEILEYSRKYNGEMTFGIVVSVDHMLETETRDDSAQIENLREKMFNKKYRPEIEMEKEKTELGLTRIKQKIIGARVFSTLIQNPR